MADGLWKVEKVPAGERANGGPVEGGGMVVALFGGCPLIPSRLHEFIPDPFREEEDERDERRGS